MQILRFLELVHKEYNWLLLGFLFVIVNTSHLLALNAISQVISQFDNLSRSSAVSDSLTDPKWYGKQWHRQQKDALEMKYYWVSH